MFMKNIQLTQRETAFLAIATAIGYFAMAGWAGWLITPRSFGEDQLPLVNIVISLALALFAWSTFKLVEPLRYSRNWQIVQLIFVPLVWLLLLATIDVAINYVIQSDQASFYNLYNLIAQM